MTPEVPKFKNYDVLKYNFTFLKTSNFLFGFILPLWQGVFKHHLQVFTKPNLTCSFMFQSGLQLLYYYLLSIELN